MPKRLNWQLNPYTHVTGQKFDDFYHDSHIRRTFELDREAAARGDEPFGSVLVHDDTVIMTESNRV